MNKKYVVDLTQEELACLLRLIKTGKHPSRKLNRARILLLADENKTDQEIAAILHTSMPTVQRTRQRFVEGNLEYALNERRRQGRPRKLKDSAEAMLIAVWSQHEGAQHHLCFPHAAPRTVCASFPAHGSPSALTVGLAVLTYRLRLMHLAVTSGA